jgi:threonine aldolase
MRQAGIIAAAGLHALDHHLDRLADDHRRARMLAEALRDVATLQAVRPETNIVMFDVLDDALDAPAIVARAAREGVLLGAFTPRRLRAVTHLDVDDAGVERAAAVIRRAAQPSAGH